MAYKRKNAEFKKLEKKGDSAEGYLIGVTVIEFEPKKPGELPGRAPKLTMQDAKTKNRFSMLLGSTVLDDAANLLIGAKTKIVYGGKVKTNKGYQAGAWELYQDENDKLEAE
jgi:hypothetical protein